MQYVQCDFQASFSICNYVLKSPENGKVLIGFEEVQFLAAKNTVNDFNGEDILGCQFLHD